MLEKEPQINRKNKERKITVEKVRKQISSRTKKQGQKLALWKKFNKIYKSPLTELRKTESERDERALNAN